MCVAFIEYETAAAAICKSIIAILFLEGGGIVAVHLLGRLRHKTNPETHFEIVFLSSRETF